MSATATACKAAAVAAGGMAAAECAEFFGVPRDVLFSALAGACIGLARRDSGEDWRRFTAPGKTKAEYAVVFLRAGLLAFSVLGNAVVCSWLAQLARHLPLTERAATLAPMPVAGLLAWASWSLLPAALDALKAYIKNKGNEPPKNGGPDSGEGGGDV